MSRWIVAATLTVATLLLGTAVEAQMVIVEPDDFTEEQVLTNAVAGVTLSVADGDGIPQATSRVVAYQGDYSSTGNLVFGRQVQAFAPDDNWFFTTIFVHSEFRADFGTPVAQVSIDTVRKQERSGAILAFDSSGTLLATATTAPGEIGTSATATIGLPTANIAYILAGGYPEVSGPPYNIVALDNFRFNHDLADTPPFNAGDYFPLQTGDQWTYQVNGDPDVHSTASVLSGTFLVNGVQTKAMETQGPLGTITSYFTNDANGIRLHRQINANGTTTFNPPIQLAAPTTSLGQAFASNGTATLSVPGQGTFQLNYSATSSVPVLVTTGVPAGDFDTVKVVLDFTISGTVAGMPISSSETDAYWLAQYIGAVKASVLFEGQTTTSELVSAFVDHDSDGVSATIDNCPDVANPAQTNTDGDSQGNACDSDDDNDEVPDDSDEFPLDPDEWADNDADGVGNNADPDDDNDLIPDAFETANGLDPFDPTDALADLDGDGFSNVEEFQAGSNIYDPQSNPDAISAAVFVILKLILDNEP